MTGNWTPDDQASAAKLSSDWLAAWAGHDPESDDLPDPLAAHPALGAYAEAMTEQAVAEAEVAKWADRRALAVARLSGDGWSYARIGEALGLSRSRVQQLVERGREVEPDG